MEMVAIITCHVNLNFVFDWLIVCCVIVCLINGRLAQEYLLKKDGLTDLNVKNKWKTTEWLVKKRTDIFPEGIVSLIDI